MTTFPDARIDSKLLFLRVGGRVVGWSGGRVVGWLDKMKIRLISAEFSLAGAKLSLAITAT